MYKYECLHKVSLINIQDILFYYILRIIIIMFFYLQILIDEFKNKC